MQGSIDALYNRVGTMKTPNAPAGNRQRIERAPSDSRRFSPYDGTSENVDATVGAGPRGVQSGYRPTVLNRNVLPAEAGLGAKYNQIEALWTGRTQLPYGGNPPEQKAALAATLPGAEGLTLTPLGGSRVAQPDMTSEVPSENGISSYGGFGPAPDFFPKYQGDPDYTPSGWGLNATPRPSALQISMPTPNPGANGDGSDGIFQLTRDGSASIGGPAAQPFASINWRSATASRVQGQVEAQVNSPMLVAVMAALDKVGTYGGNPQWDETQHGEILWQAVEDIGVLAQQMTDTQNLSPDKLPHSFFNLPTLNYWLASLGDDGRKPPRTLNDVKCLVSFHGMIRNDSSARMGQGERFGLSARIFNCVVNGGEEMVFNEWNATRENQKLYYLVKRIDHNDIRAVGDAPPGSFALQGFVPPSKNNVMLVADDKTRKPWQIVPWVYKDQAIQERPRKKDVEFTDEYGAKAWGGVFEVGYTVQVDGPNPLPLHLKQAPCNAAARKQLPMIFIAVTGRWIQL